MTLVVNFFVVETFIVKDMKNAGVRQAEGVKFTVESKQEMAQWLKQCMVEKKLKIPYDPELIAELNIERFELKRMGKSFSHPEGSRDDRFWSLASACYAARETASQGFGWCQDNGRKTG